MRTITSIIETVNVSQFRRNLKQYLDALRTPEHHILRIGHETCISPKDILVLTPATLRRIQTRSYFNTILYHEYTKQSLMEYPTLAKGIKTKTLPSDTLLGFCALFRVLQDVLDLVQSDLTMDYPHAWTVRDYLLPLVEEQRPVVHRRFDEVYTITQKLVRSTDLCQKRTLIDYLEHLKHLSMDSNAITCIHLANESLTEEQVNMIKTGISCVCTATLTLIYAQDLGESAPQPYQSYQAFSNLFQWVQDNVTGQPIERNVSAFILK